MRTDGLMIVAAAVYWQGLVFSQPAPARHSDVLRAMAACGITLSGQMEQGFLTGNGQFVRRRAARLIAERAGQVRVSNDDDAVLISEDLW